MGLIVLGGMYPICETFGRLEERGNGETSKPSDSKTSRSAAVMVYMFFSTRLISSRCLRITTFLRIYMEGSELSLAMHLLLSSRAMKLGPI